jgi:DNA-directed RNA polymerase subunit RPC12/RpoP
VAKVKAAPTVCPRCGAAMTAPVLRGVDSIRCEYCGNVVRL